MEQVTLNKTDLRVSEICLGADVFGSRFDRETAFGLLDRFRDAGGNFVDTANIYSRDFEAGYSRSERFLGDYLRSRGKSALIVATKGAHPNPKTMHTPRISREELTRDIDESLCSLGLDCIDFYWLHRDDPSMPIGEIIELLEEFVRLGKIRFYGGSNYSRQRLLEADEYAKAHGLHGFSAVSNMWSPAVQNVPYFSDDTLVSFDDGDLGLFDSTGMAFVPYSSTARGWFSKRAVCVVGGKLSSVYENPQNLALLERLKGTGKPVQTALLEHIRSYPEQIIPITSVSRPEQLDDILAVHSVNA